MLNAFFISESENPTQKEALLNDVKSQVKKLMEEAVVRSYVHEENTIITTLCASVEAILCYGLRQNIFTFFDDNSTLALCRRISKSCPGAQQVLDRMDYHRKAMHQVPRPPLRGYPPVRDHSRSRNSSTQPTNRRMTVEINARRPDGPVVGQAVVYRARPRGAELRRPVSMLSGPLFSTPDPKLKTLWIRVALLEKVLDKIIFHLASNAQRYYEKNSIMADPCDGMLVADLLRGPCAVDYSRTRTTDYLYTDPPVTELIQRHGISGSLRSRQLPYISPSCQTKSSRDMRSISVLNLPTIQSSAAIRGNETEKTKCFTLESTSKTCNAGGFQSRRISSTTNILHISDDGSLSNDEVASTPFCGSRSTLLARRKLVLAAKEHVESMHQGVRSTLLYGKNNVLMQAMDSDRTMPGYLSLHNYGEPKGLVLKWTPNWAMSVQAPSVDLPSVGNNFSLDTAEHSEKMVYPNIISADGANDCNLPDTQRDAYWKYAIKVKLKDLVYIHCHAKDDTYMIVLVRKDGVQLPPMTFYAKSHLPTFLHCLEHSIESDGGFLDPRYSDFASQSHNSDSTPQSSSNTPIGFGTGPFSDSFTSDTQAEPNTPLDNLVSMLPRFRPSNDKQVTQRPITWDRSLFDRWLSLSSPQSAYDAPTHKNIMSQTDVMEEEAPELRTFRIVGGNPGRGQLPKRNLFQQNSTPQEIDSDGTKPECFSGEPDLLTRSCESISRTILRESFRRWLLCCRRLRVIRSRLTDIVSPCLLTVDVPTNAAEGLTPALWDQLRNSGDTDFTFLELCRLVYFGNCDPSLRRQVWPFLLGVYSWNATSEELVNLDRLNEQTYQTALAEWQHAQLWVKDPDKLDGLPQLQVTRISARNNRRPNRSAKAQSCYFATNERFDFVSNFDSPDVRASDVRNQLTIDDPNRITAKTSESDSQTPTAFPDNHVTPVADVKTRFQCNGLVESEQAKMDVQPRSELSPDSGASVDSEFDDLSESVTHDGAPYSDNIINALGMNLYRIDKDVSRCDRNHYYFANPKKNLTSDNIEISNNDSDFPELNNNLTKLRNVICTWVWLHLDVGYIQGMCDLLAPLLVVLQDEGLTYACFCRLMEWMLPNFPVSKISPNPSSQDSGVGCYATYTTQPCEAPATPEKHSKRERLTLLALSKQAEVSTQISPSPSAGSVDPLDDRCSDLVEGSHSPEQSPVHSLPTPTVTSPYASAVMTTSTNFMDLRFANLKALIEFFDPELHNFLTGKAHETQFYFCYRWLLLDFKREFKYDDVYAIWEIIWASRRLVAYDFGIFLALALLQYYRDIILYYDMDLTEIIRFYNEMTEQHSRKAILDLARSLVFQMQNAIHDS